MAKKEHYMDYVTHAFVTYFRLGCPTRAALETDIIAKAQHSDAEVSARRPLLEDVEAVNRVIERLKSDGRTEVIDALKVVYVADGRYALRRGAVSARVRRFAVERPAAERTVYKWLKMARKMFCEERGLNIEP